ncbi:hypothetical protein SAMN04488511_11628 [Pedobacter suwonensis]|uniref:Uncharacterized protein n=1 Tax=Pedobacter suwonensis TaxID=332999 RepID=A0A1I0TXY8_9SPHI|nr:hypothetical protein [Pedobacter suwonensis]SFA56530.1 hypothetical protein SAMN04488511_11628 [Pedobacter suwonensis]
MDKQIFSTIAPEALAQMLQKKLAEGEIEIGFAQEGENTMSVVTKDEYNTDQEFSLHYHSNGLFEIVYRFYDDDHTGGWIILSHILSEEEIRMLPEGLQPLMAKVAHSGNPIKITGRQLASANKI